MQKFLGKHWPAVITVLLLTVTLIWVTTTNSLLIWPYRNTLQYHILTWWWQQVGYPQPGPPGTLRGTVRNTYGKPITDAWVLTSWWDGTTYSARSTADGSYTISQLPASQYRLVAGALGYDDIQVNTQGWLTVTPGNETETDITLPPAPHRVVTLGTDFRFDELHTLTCTKPFKIKANRQPFTFDNNGLPNQPALYYTPLTTTTTSRLPVLMIVYPGPAASWDCASLPLAAAGYAVVALGPAYSVDLEADIDELERVVGFIRAGQFPGSDGSRLAVLGGSYSGLLVQRLLQRSPHYEAAVLLGPPTDLFDMRRRLEERSYIPPFGLDQVMVALGLPDREPLRYWRYSGAYHIRPDFPPLAIMHSRTDEVVPFQQSELLSDRLTQMGVAHHSYFFDGASHYLLAEGGDKDTLEIYRLTLEFLAEHLK